MVIEAFRQHESRIDLCGGMARTLRNNDPPTNRAATLFYKPFVHTGGVKSVLTLANCANPFSLAYVLLTNRAKECFTEEII
jgi:hypothetical protein